MASNHPSVSGTAFGWLTKLLATGSGHASDLTRQRKIIQCNMAAFLGAGNVVAYNILFALSGNPALIRSGLAQIPIGVLLVGSVLWLNRKGSAVAARWVVFFLSLGLVTAAMLGRQGSVLHTHWYFLVVGILSVVIFPSSPWHHTLIVATLGLGLFAYVEVNPVPAHVDLLTLTPSAKYAFQSSIAASCAIVVLVLMMYSEHASAKNERDLHEMANTDPLTHVANRRAFRKRLLSNLLVCRRRNTPLCVAMLDIDHFKQINDVYGHDVGDLVLQTLGEVLQSHLRPDDLLARMGGEEFAILLPGASLEQSLVVCERLRQTVEATPFGTDDARLRVTISLGLAVFTENMHADGGLKAADTALYAAKQAGRNKVVIQA